MALAGLESQSTRPLEMRKGCLKVGCVEKVDSFQRNGITASIVTRAGKKIFNIFTSKQIVYRSTANKNSPFDSLRLVNVASMLHEELHSKKLTLPLSVW